MGIFESIKTNENHIQELIIKFYEETMTEFNQQKIVEDYVFDVYIDIEPNEHVKLIDVNPWKEFTNPLLFTFENLEKIQENKEIMFKIIENEDDAFTQDYSKYKVPEELTSEQPPETIIDMIKIMHNKDPELYQ
eukprot:TRINITY_DN23670_c0_g1_i2.p2 TRINITY_DN23670_c0_g1~~TRINITY_DN23670_c0_g1_i2.p2  ORF type:complete len:134 (-),score=30.74 TRINITY_DN23670_c0_g1_i2:281-682(-)